MKKPIKIAIILIVLTLAYLLISGKISLAKTAEASQTDEEPTNVDTETKIGPFALPKQVFSGPSGVKVSPGKIIANTPIFDKDSLMNSVTLKPNQNIGKLIAQTPTFVAVEYFNKSNKKTYNWLAKRADVIIK